MPGKTIICLPTYNEAENITPTVKSILHFLPGAEILIIDDHSPDGTGRIAEHLAQGDSRIAVLHRPEKAGLGSAYLEGFDIAINRMDAKYIVQMDADLSHPPEALPRMMRAMAHADLVIGSRYVPGGGTRNWNAARRLISRFGARYARTWLDLPVHDPTGGFKIWKRRLLQKVLDYPISAGGYVFQVETTHIAFCMGAVIRETPIRFTDRHVGQSKMSPAIALEAFWRIPAIRLYGPKVGGKGKGLS